MTELHDFLLARIAEDETIIRSQIVAPTPQLPHEPPRPSLAWWPLCLADCQAKRKIVERAKLLTATWSDLPTTQAQQGYNDGVTDTVGDFLRLLASPYAAHPDYRPEWRPAP